MGTLLWVAGLEGCRLEGCRLEGCRLEGCRLEGCRLEDRRVGGSLGHSDGGRLAGTIRPHS
ncbi:pentapeptide repeat-containing protein [Catenulispora sp. NF23]|nr:pentapeptide repeat-containing protein [Catenulispora pinistramenti]